MTNPQDILDALSRPKPPAGMRHSDWEHVVKGLLVAVKEDMPLGVIPRRNPALRQLMTDADVEFEFLAFAISTLLDHDDLCRRVYAALCLNENDPTFGYYVRFTADCWSALYPKFLGWKKNGFQVTDWLETL